MATALGQLERQWLGKKITGGVTPQIPLEQMRRMYYNQVLGSSVNGFMGDLTPAWLKKEITNRGGTPPASNYEGDIWKVLVATIGQTPSDRISQNKIVFYSIAA